MDHVIEISQLKIGYHRKNKNPFLVAGPMDMVLKKGELTCLIGPNGAGKSTLLRTISGVQDPLEGRIQIMGQNLGKLDNKRRAAMISLVLTEILSPMNLRVTDLVSMGRYPHTGWFGTMSENDLRTVKWAISSTGMDGLIERNLFELSDGERQKTMIARALAQDTPLILLDEPTAHLDVTNRVAIIKLLRSLAVETGKSIVFSTHDLDMALQASDRVWLLDMDKHLYCGSPEDLVLDGTFESIFHSQGAEFDIGTGLFRINTTATQKINIRGSEIDRFWLQRALNRHGYMMDDRAGNIIDIENRNGVRSYNCRFEDLEIIFGSIVELTDHLLAVKRLSE